MENFIVHNPTSLHFGKGATDTLGEHASRFGRRILLVYGKGSVRKNGTYDVVMKQLKKSGCDVVEYAGIQPNPILDDVDAAATLGRRHGVSAIVALGGGSVIDSAKFISIAIPVKRSAWDFIEKKAEVKTSIPVLSVLTLAATGTEMNAFAVIQNEKTKQKPGFYCPHFFPRHSFLDPEFTYSVPRDQTAYGIVDLMAHCLEGFYGKGESMLADRFAIAIMREAIEIAPKLLADPKNYELRARMMLAATYALNGTAMVGKAGGDWAVHGFGHSLSVLYGVPHGASLSIAYPAWMKHFIDVTYRKTACLGKELFDAGNAAETVVAFEKFFKKTGCPVRLSEIKIGRGKKPEILQNLKTNSVNGNRFKLEERDINAILDLML
jgi:alcohol dehydrogenase YqhD (iron-dependent ADH family)